jgi:hypothetical protein
MLRVERQVLGTNEFSAYWAVYGRDTAHYFDAPGTEQRHVIDMRFAGKAGGYDWDIEGMDQVGSVGDKTIVAWAVGARAGYTFDDFSWMPRLGLQVDVGSGDKNPGNGTVGTFNPLFPSKARNQRHADQKPHHHNSAGIAMEADDPRRHLCAAQHCHCRNCG